MNHGSGIWSQGSGSKTIRIREIRVKDSNYEASNITLTQTSQVASQVTRHRLFHDLQIGFAYRVDRKGLGERLGLG